ncbi:MAG TPA: hypothetical protein VMX13_06560 [Sedimentisphaerales bacterium]|nr:hypothetical protein [Sedimentisphaerales bacterium]
MEVQRDFKELLALLNEHKVEYLIVGGYALAFHGAPRYTGDLDILVKADKQNAERILAALDDFGFADLDLKPADFEASEMVVQLGVAPVRVDIITSLTGVDWGQACAGRVRGKYGDIAVHFLGREQFIANKRATGRKRDLADLEALGED